ncbi:MAG: hypothetical protein RL757_2506 [Bacteroidota bacterium]|jgi:hypothetical protein
MTTIFIKIKKAGKRHLKLAKEPIEIADMGAQPTLKTLIVAIATQQIEAHNAKIIEKPIIDFLTETAIEAAADTGKVGFGTLYNDQKVAIPDAIQNVLTAFTDGLYVVSVDNKIVEKLENSIEITPNSIVTFIRLTALIGV